jgi:hypothetical protein
MLHAWESAAIALHFADGFEERYQKSVQRGNELLRLLEQKNVKVHRLDAGTNIFQVEFPVAAPADFQKRLAERGITVSRPPAQGPMNLMVNETILRRPAEEIAGEIFRVLG